MDLIDPDRRLWPDDETESTSTVPFLALGNPAAGRVLIPASPLAVSGQSLIRHHGGMTHTERFIRRTAATSARMGILRVLLRKRRHVDLGDPDDPSSLRHVLAAATGEDRPHIAASFGPTRSNQKPVIRVMRADGVAIAYAKIGWTPLTARLVEAEVTALKTPGVRDLKTVKAPQVLHYGMWQSKRIAVFEAVPGRPGRVDPSEEAFTEVARLWGSEHQTLNESEFANTLITSAETVEGSNSVRARATAQNLLERYGSESFRFSGWHGDWTPWNNARYDKPRIALWDWERAGEVAPEGFDSIHYRFQPIFIRSRHNLADLLESATSGLINTSANQRSALAHLYAAGIALRHLQPDSDRGPVERSIQLLDEIDQLIRI